MIQTQDKWTEFSVLIPFHHRYDLLIPLLKSLQEVPVLVVDDGINRSFFSEDIHCIQSGNVGFAKAVNCGLEYLAARGITTVLVLNDDACISVPEIEKMLEFHSDNMITAPVIQINGNCIYGANVQSWGRVRANYTFSCSPDAVYGTCLMIPSSVRFDDGYVHGFEDIELCRRLKREGYQIQVIDNIFCQHIGEASLSAATMFGQRSATYGHLRLFSSLRKAPVIASLSLAQIILENGSRERYVGFVQGLLDWFYKDVPSLAARKASSKAGSNKAR